MKTKECLFSYWLDFCGRSASAQVYLHGRGAGKVIANITVKR